MMKYNEELVQRCSEWVRENGLMEYGGARLNEYCSHFGITRETHSKWMRKEEYSEAINKAKEDFRQSIEQRLVKSLANAAIGREYTQTTVEYKNVDGKKKIMKQTDRTMVVEPNIGAAIFLLTNIAPDKWQNKQRQELSGSVSGVTIVVDNQEDAELMKGIEDL